MIDDTTLTISTGWVEAAIQRSEAGYPVNDIYRCVQGEGVQTGVAMVLLRLHGCVVACPWCDTKETWGFDSHNAAFTIADVLGANPKYVFATASSIAQYIWENHPGPKWVLITGGEPARQDLRHLVAVLHEYGYKVAIETSGTEIGHVDAGLDWVCISPKINMPGGRQLRRQAFAVADEIKHVVGKVDHLWELDALLEQMQGVLKPNVQICLQPLSTSPKATALCMAMVQDRGWRLSIQMHKYIGVR